MPTPFRDRPRSEPASRPAFRRPYRQDLSTSPAYPGYRSIHSSHILPESRQIMRIVCPSCAATYEIADGLLVRPRTVRCSRCARQWMQEKLPAADNEDSGTAIVKLTEPPATPVAELDPVQAPPSPPPAIAEPTEPLGEAGRLPPPAPEPRGARLTLAWVASLLLLGVLAYAAYRFRAEIQLAWPPSTRLFRLLAD